MNPSTRAKCRFLWPQMCILSIGWLALIACNDDPRCGNDLCRSDEVCVDATCVLGCNEDADCPITGERCRQGICEQVLNPACATDSDCTSPSLCEANTGTCVGGSCIYPPAPAGTPCSVTGNQCLINEQCDGFRSCIGTQQSCLTPPNAECVDNDSVLRQYFLPGSCQPATGECVYQQRNITCPNCSSECLPPCTPLFCQATGCVIELCQPLPTASCVPELTRGDGQNCLGESGVCQAGACVECIADDDCNAVDPCEVATCDTGSNTCQTNCASTCTLCDGSCEPVCANP